MLDTTEEWTVFYRRARPAWMTDATWKQKSTQWQAVFTSFEVAWEFMIKGVRRGAVEVTELRSSRGARIPQELWDQILEKAEDAVDAYALAVGAGAIIR